MNLPPPQNRKCEICLNTMTLNLFRLNSLKCRYCQDGLSVPQRLSSNNAIQEASKFNDSLMTQTDLVNSIDQNDPNINSPAEVNDQEQILN